MLHTTLVDRANFLESPAVLLVRGARTIGFFAALVACGVSALAAELTLLDGRVLEGSISSWQDNMLEVSSDGQTLSLAADQVLRIRYALAAEAEVHTNVELTDGTLIPFEEFGVHGNKATIKPPGAERPLVVETKRISTVHLQAPTPTIASQWHDLKSSNEAGDLIVIRKDNAIDHLAGRLGDVSPTHVMFYLDGDEFPVERGRVDGVVYYHAQPERYPDPLCVIRSRRGMRIAASAVHLGPSSLTAQTASRLEITLNLDEVESIDFSAGKIVFLSELTPRSSVNTPLVALPPSAQLAARLAQPVPDRGFLAAEALLRYPQMDGDRMIGWQLKSHSRAVALRSRSEVTYPLPSGFRNFRATAGIDGTLEGRGNVRLALFGENQLLFEATVDGSEPPVLIDVEVGSARFLRILVDYGEGGDTADRLYLCDARITK